MSFQNTAEGGVNGVTPTTSDTGSGNAFTVVSKGPNSVLDYSNLNPAHGSLGYRLGNHSATPEQNYMEWTAGSSLTDFWNRFYYLYEDTPTVAPQLMQVRSGTSSLIATVISLVGQKIAVQDSSGTIIWRTTLVISPNVQYRVETNFSFVTSAWNVQVLLYIGDSNTVTEDSGVFSIGAGQASSSNVIRWGRSSSTALWPNTTGYIYLDDLAAFGASQFGPATISKDQTAIARIRKSVTATQTATARVLSAGSTKSQTARARIQKTGLTKTQTATASIVASGVRLKTQTAIARVQKIFTKTQGATANVLAPGTRYGMSNTAAVSGSEGDTAANWKAIRDAYMTSNVQWRREYVNNIPASYTGGDPALGIKTFLSFQSSYTNILNGTDKTAIQAYASTWPANTYATWEYEPDDPAKEFVANPAANFVTPFQTVYGWVKQVRPDVLFGPIYQAVQWYNNGTADPVLNRATRWVIDPAYADFYGVDWYNQDTNLVDWNLGNATDFQNWWTIFSVKNRPIWVTEFGIRSATSTPAGKNDADTTTIINASHGWANTHHLDGILYANVLNANSGANDYQLTPSISDPAGRPAALSAWISWVQTITQTTQVSRAAIRKTGVTKTQTATAHIDSSYFGSGFFGVSEFAPLQVSYPRTDINATARIRIVGRSLIQPATARISGAQVSKTQPATARVQRSFTKTQAAIARILRTGQTKTQGAIARVALAAPTKTQTAIARIVVTQTKTQVSVARIFKSGLTKTQGSTARIRVTSTKTQTSLARVQILSTKTQLANARISKSRTQTQTATASIIGLGVVTTSQTAIAAIQIAGLTKTQPAIARVAKDFTKTQTSVARLAKPFTKTQTSLARVSTSSTKTQTTIARIQKSFTKTQTTVARVQTTGTKTQTSIARMRVAGNTKTQSARATIGVAGLTKTQTSVARIQITGQRLTQPAIAFIQLSRTSVQTATATISNRSSKTQTATARIIPYTILAVGSIRIRVG